MLPVAAEPSFRRPAGPLAGVRVLALEQMQALPFATQLLGRLGADVVKVEPLDGELGRAAEPSIPDPLGRRLGATFLRNNLGKRSICVNTKSARGRQLILDLAPRFDVVAENFRPGTMARLGLSFDDVVSVHPACVYASVSGFGNRTTSPYRNRPAYAPVVEAMSGIYEMKRQGDGPPSVSPVGALGDIGAALFASVGILAALRERDRTGQRAIRRCRDVRLRCGHDRHRLELLVLGPEEWGHRSGHQPRLPCQRRLVHHPGRTRTPLRAPGRARRSGRTGRPIPASPLAKGGWTTSTPCFVPPLNAGRRTRRVRAPAPRSRRRGSRRDPVSETTSSWAIPISSNTRCSSASNVRTAPNLRSSYRETPFAFTRRRRPSIRGSRGSAKTPTPSFNPSSGCPPTTSRRFGPMASSARQPMGGAAAHPERPTHHHGGARVCRSRVRA